MSISSTIEPTLAPTIFPVGQFIANDDTAHTLISYTDWKLYIAVGLFITLCVSVICLIKCCKKYDKIRESDIHKTIQNNKSILDIPSPQSNINIRNDLHIVLDKETKQKYINSKLIEDEKNINIHHMTNPNRTRKITLEPTDNSSDDSITFEPMTRYSKSNADAKQKRLKKYKMKNEKNDNINIEINAIQMENEKQICVNAVNLSFDHDLNPILYTGMSVINPENIKFSNSNDMNINGKIIGINEGREHSITESSTFTMKSHHGIIGTNEDNIDHFKMFTKGQHTKLMEIQSECENLIYVNDIQHEQKKNNKLTVSTDETNCS
eukprot:316670_1